MSAASINNVIGKRFIELLSVDSTNNYAMQQVQNSNADHGDAFFAFEQTAGRGQFNRQWLSAKGENIMLSVVLNTRELALNKQFLLNMACALSILDLFNKYTTEKIKIKWPNDIYCRDRKAAGILVENMIRGKNWQFAIAGFGININQTEFPAAAKRPVSLKQVTGETYNTVELAKEFCVMLNERMRWLYAGHDHEILNDYNRHLYSLNETENFKYGSVVFPAIIKGVNESGNIVLDSGIEKPYRSGEIEWLV
ncbi:biotin--[acetyl-CoA-carboxylase] ligase [Parafilimonas terrae]|uniref:BirA family transcriptional regulator, biotin operon repressor / biotin-[acetyl-CoA-carboxylase] ligase n=1 Tax=Parafilimonas terrae TaxID=1465490 RepID=A0A1I5RE02_9BACT|nr:biotin--[acetyl-CoA-carboxylase] ligase [Parafilimonas terrae]SFP56752.1 BirA family transcriptional regulator, biotin operon repressor / biotin-[acetyl-CoA-carboxylase] ligase [Parafilimonas terrae]